jgi:hypothetical protein
MVASLPFVAALAGIYVNGWHSDRKGERILHTATPLLIVSAGIFLTALFYDVPVVPILILIFVVGPAMFAHMPAFWPIPTMFLGAAAAASAIGFINMLGNLGGHVGPDLVGKAYDKPPTQTVMDGSKDAPSALSQPPNSTPSNAPPATASSPPGGYRTSLLYLAPWPLGAAIIILIVGFLRGRISRQPAPSG